jgi:D-alanyl-D-alanine carboxypeptidase
VAAPEVSAEAVAIIDRSCGALLYGKNERARLPPASLTKIVTAIVVEERADLASMVDVKVSAKEMARRGSSVMGVEPGMQVSVIDLLYGLFLPSGNDAALALADHVSGSASAFAGLMNEKARRLGMVDTNFTNPHGLDNSGLYSTAYDMAIAGRAFLDRPLLAQISVTPTYKPTIADWSDFQIRNGNRLLQTYPGAFGVKIGYTTRAKQTIVAAAVRDGREIIVSLLRSDDRYKDSTALLDWAFAYTPRGC